MTKNINRSRNNIYHIIAVNKEQLAIKIIGPREMKIVLLNLDVNYAVILRDKNGLGLMGKMRVLCILFSSLFVLFKAAMGRLGGGYSGEPSGWLLHLFLQQAVIKAFTICFYFVLNCIGSKVQLAG